ncbi:MAG: peptidoglycan D,D-transpeptidase FtsI family protein [Vulcanimicrobiota bacterium]
MDKTDKYIKNVFRFYMMLFFVLGLYIIYIMGVEALALETNPLNPRNREELDKRGTVFTRSGIVLAISKKEDGKTYRKYPGGREYQPLLGYWSKKYGKSGLEAQLDSHLVSGYKHDNVISTIARTKQNGKNIYLTIDDEIQKVANEVLEGEKGAVVVLNPGNGEILALASSPSYESEELDDNWLELARNKDAPFLLRAVNGYYPPGSVFKLFTYAACLEEGLIIPTDTFSCTGEFAIKYPLGTYHIREAGGTAHGTVTAEDAVTHSCNIAFAQMGLALGAPKFIDYAGKFGLNQNPEFLAINSKSRFPTVGELSRSILAQSAFGQGEILLSPLQIALMVSAFANEGKICQPILIKAIADDKGKVVKKSEPSILKEPVSPATAEKVRNAMVEVVRRGTGWRAYIEGMEVAGKTGSAENASGNTHAWFAGFAPAGNPEVLVVVIIENGGGGGTTAAPKAREVIRRALNI